MKVLTTSTSEACARPSQAAALASRQESTTEGSWFSHEQLVDAFKSEPHAEKYETWCGKNSLVKRDTKRDCRVYYYTKKLEKFGTRKEGVSEYEVAPDGEDRSVGSGWSVNGG